MAMTLGQHQKRRAGVFGSARGGRDAPTEVSRARGPAEWARETARAPDEGRVGANEARGRVRAGERIGRASRRHPPSDHPVRFRRTDDRVRSRENVLRVVVFVVSNARDETLARRASWSAGGRAPKAARLGEFAARPGARASAMVPLRLPVVPLLHPAEMGTSPTPRAARTRERRARTSATANRRDGPRDRDRVATTATLRRVRLSVEALARAAESRRALDPARASASIRGGARPRALAPRPRSRRAVAARAAAPGAPDRSRETDARDARRRRLLERVRGERRDPSPRDRRPDDAVPRLTLVADALPPVRRGRAPPEAEARAERRAARGDANERNASSRGVHRRLDDPRDPPPRATHLPAVVTVTESWLERRILELGAGPGARAAREAQRLVARSRRRPSPGPDPARRRRAPGRTGSTSSTNISGGVLQHSRGVRFFGDDEDARARRRALVVDPARSGGGAWQTDEGSPRAMRRSAESLRRAADDTLRARTRDE